MDLQLGCTAEYVKFIHRHCFHSFMYLFPYIHLQVQPKDVEIVIV